MNLRARGPQIEGMLGVFESAWESKLRKNLMNSMPSDSN